jgi:hypothetical protein
MVRKKVEDRPRTRTRVGFIGVGVGVGVEGDGYDVPVFQVGCIDYLRCVRQRGQRVVIKRIELVGEELRRGVGV